MARIGAGIVGGRSFYGMNQCCWLADNRGGKAILEDYKILNMDVVSYLYGPMPTQPLGWFKKPVGSRDMKG
jgi:TRAP-type mannitol/chloroaromatic compound transport system substrate-binding protein